MNWEKINDFRRRAGSNLHGELFWLTKTHSPTAGVCPVRLVKEFAAKFHANLETPGKLPPYLKILANEDPENNRLKQWLLHKWKILKLDVPTNVIRNLPYSERSLLREIFNPATIDSPLAVIILGELLDVQEIIGTDLYFEIMRRPNSLVTAYIGLEIIPQHLNNFSGYYLDSETQFNFVLQLKKTIPIR